MAGIKVAITKYNNWLKDNGYSFEEEKELYDLLLQDIYENPRWYLDNLDSLITFRVSWHEYKKNKKNYAVMPYKYTRFGEDL